MVAKQFIITGKVQKVGYRRFAQKKAKSLDIFGFARNEANGDVTVVGQGSETALESFEEYLRKGPLLARVKMLKSSVINIDESCNEFLTQ